jgi:hypothetical protein
MIRNYPFCTEDFSNYLSDLCKKEEKNLIEAEWLISFEIFL